MEPAELAALVVREADAGVAAALGAFDAAGALTVDTIIGRVGSLPRSATDGWQDIVWQAEIVMRPSAASAPRVPLFPPEAAADPPRLVAAMPVTVLRGVGRRWGAWLAGHGVQTVGDLANVSPATVAQWSTERSRYAAVLVGRARACCGPWPAVEKGDRRSVLDVALADPGHADTVGTGARERAHALWGHCLRLLAALDDRALRDLPVGGLRR